MNVMKEVIIVMFKQHVQIFQEAIIVLVILVIQEMVSLVLVTFQILFRFVESEKKKKE